MTYQSATMSNVPQEIVDHIVDLLSFDQQTLFAVSLVSRAWNTASRPHIFRSIDLSVIDTHRLADLQRFLSHYIDLYALLHRNPRLVYYIREVTIGGVLSPILSPWKFVEKIFVKITGKLCQVQFLRLREVMWIYLSDEARHALITLCRLPTIQQLVLYNCQLPNFSELALLLRSPRTLENLQLSHIRTQKSSQRRRGLVVPRHCSIQQLVIAGSEVRPIIAGILDPSCCLNFSGLRKLEITGIKDALTIGQVLTLAGSHLEELTLSAASEYVPEGTIGDDVNFALTPRLRHAELQGVQFTRKYSGVPCVTNLLRTRGVPSNLESVLISMVVDNHKVDWTEWQAIDQELADAGFRSLQKVEVIVHMRSRAEQRKIQRSLEVQFPKLSSKNLLSIMYCI
ncbi:hypothetical protein AMATHDRAFT_41733 [Amanita thiersii Skay4041]|uniref:F-box domain-containing protein n=1 Tax=Amanita thiersii Skay4041 TaxID=703135 RepID=A0A2A9NN30_9AGAR|nr:hypothetical protein AMATHDRAFT_41733 [Amanita thiersii Skay4041]